MNETKLSRILTKQGRKKSWLAAELNVDKSTITRWVKGETSPRQSRRPEIARLLGLDIQDVF